MDIDFDLLDLSEESLLFNRVITKYGNITTYICNVPALLKFMSPLNDFIYTKRQRPYDTDHITKMKESQLKHYLEKKFYPFLCSTICLGRCPETGLKIIDGQHRLHVMHELFRWDPETLTDTEILVRIVESKDESELFAHFVEINDQHLPVAKYHLSEEIKEVVDIVVAQMLKSYPGWTSAAPSPYRPNMNVGTLKHELSNKCKNYIELNGTGDSSALASVIFSIFSEYNTELARHPYTDFMQSKSDAACMNAHAKLLKFGDKALYLGMVPEFKWIADAFEHRRKKSLALPKPKLNVCKKTKEV